MGSNLKNKINKYSDPKRYTIAWFRVFWAIYESNELISMRAWEKSHKTPSSPYWIDSHQIRHVGSSRGPNQLCRIFYQSIQGFRSVCGQNSTFPVDFRCRPLMHCCATALPVIQFNSLSCRGWDIPFPRIIWCTVLYDWINYRTIVIDDYYASAH